MQIYTVAHGHNLARYALNAGCRPGIITLCHGIDYQAITCWLFPYHILSRFAYRDISTG